MKKEVPEIHNDKHPIVIICPKPGVLADITAGVLSFIYETFGTKESKRGSQKAKRKVKRVKD